MSRRKGMSWDDFMKKDTSMGGNFGTRLKDWRNDGSIVVFLHTKSMITARHFHLIPYVEEVEENGKKKPKVRFFAFVCHEHPEAKFNNMPAVNCPLCRLIEALADDGRYDDDAIVWDASIGNTKFDRIATKLDFCGLDGGDWRNSFKPRAQYVFVVVDVDDVEEGLQVAEESYMLGEGLKTVIKQQIESEEEEGWGNPALNPYAFKFKYNAKSKTPSGYYEVFPFRKQKISDEIEELLEQDAVDISKNIEPGDATKLFDIMTNHVKVDIDIAQFFDNLATEGEEVIEKTSKSKTRKQAKPKPAPKPEPEPEPEADGDECDTCGGAGTIGKKKVDCPDCEGSGKNEPEPEPEPEPEADPDPEVEQVPCETCQGMGTIGRKKVECPDCGGSGLTDSEAEPEPEADPEPEPEPEKPKPPKSPGRPPKNKKGGGKKSEAKKPKAKPKEPEPEVDMFRCGGCKRMVPEGENVCPHCGAEFEDEED